MNGEVYNNNKKVKIGVSSPVSSFFLILWFLVFSSYSLGAVRGRKRDMNTRGTFIDVVVSVLLSGYGI